MQTQDREPELAQEQEQGHEQKVSTIGSGTIAEGEEGEEGEIEIESGRGSIPIFEEEAAPNNAQLLHFATTNTNTNDNDNDNDANPLWKQLESNQRQSAKELQQIYQSAQQILNKQFQTMTIQMNQLYASEIQNQQKTMDVQHHNHNHNGSSQHLQPSLMRCHFNFNEQKLHEFINLSVTRHPIANAPFSLIDSFDTDTPASAVTPMYGQRQTQPQSQSQSQPQNQNQNQTQRQRQTLQPMPYIARWSANHQTSKVKLTENDSKFECCGPEQSIRALHPITKGMVVQIQFDIFSSGGLNFFGVVSNNCQSFERLKTAQRKTNNGGLIDAFGIDSGAFQYLGNYQRYVPIKNWRNKPKIENDIESKLLMIVDFRTFSDCCVLAFSLDDNGLMGTPENIKQGFTIKLPAHIREWYPACSLFNSRKWCRISMV